MVNVSNQLTAEAQQLLNERMNVLTDRALNRFRDAVRAVFTDDERGRPVHEGSCILLDIHGVKLLLTAAHVMDVNTDLGKDLYITGAEHPVILDGLEFRATGKVNGTREQDHYDFAGTRIPPALEAQLGPGYVTLDDIADAAGDTKGHLFTTVGYPNSKNDDFDHVNKKVRTHVFPYSNTARIDDKLKQKVPKDGVHHIFIGYTKHSKGSDGRKVTSINPKGLSGGMLVDAGNLGDMRVFLAEIDPVPRVAGLIIERWHDQKVLVSTKIGPIVRELIELLAIPEPAEASTGDALPGAPAV